MELSQTIKIRRSIRHFNKEKVTKENIIDILEHGIKAPSAHNRQPWNFLVVNNQEKKEIIAKTLQEKTDITTALTCQVIKECSSLVLVFANITEELMDIQSVGACIENMILRATDLSIGSLWIGYIVSIEKDLQKMFNCNKKLIAAVALGYMDKIPKERPRKDLEDLLAWY